MRPVPRLRAAERRHWARRLRSEQRMRAHAHTTTQAIKEGDRPGAAANPDLDQRES